MSRRFPFDRNLPLPERFWAKVDKRGPDECWEWQAGGSGGYGQLGSGKGSGKLMWAHRYSWELANGPIPDALRVLHRCDNPPCVNPAHLFLGTQLDNMRDCATKGRTPRGRHLTHCRRGHEFTTENTYILVQKGVEKWFCRECKRIRHRGYKAA